jgi:GNAT superfamily N-acetyltransferase
MNSLTLRKANPNDSEFTYLARRAAFREYVEKVAGWDEDEQRRLHEQRFKAQEFRVVNVAGTDVGILAVVVVPDCVKVNQLLLVPEHQGKGIGRRCMALIMEEARQLGLPVRLRVMKVNPRALAFYDRLGFRRTGETDTHDLMERSS